MTTKTKLKFCPLIGDTCIGDDCQWWTKTIDRELFGEVDDCVVVPLYLFVSVIQHGIRQNQSRSDGIK